MPLDDETPLLQAVSVKLPVFWTANPRAWFAQVEAQFAIKRITVDETKYYYVVSALDADTATRALSILTSPPSVDKYQSIKSFLISAYDLTDSERAAALFNLKGLGDSKPSQLMDSMLALLADHQPCFLFRHLFLQQLPVYIRTALATSTITDSRQFALEADKYFVSGQQTQCAITTDSVLNAVQRSGTRSRGQQYGTVNDTISGQEICWYHRKYGKRAKQCISPCSYSNSTQNQGNGQRGQ